MIINLDLTKTYGQQNADIAKKNKINQIDMTVNLYPERGDDSSENSDDVSYGPITIDQNYDNLSEEKNAQSKTKAGGRTLVNDSGMRLWFDGDSDVFPSCYGTIYYKTYNISLDLNSPEYEALKAQRTQIPIYFTFDGLRKKAITPEENADEFYPLFSETTTSTLVCEDIIYSNPFIPSYTFSYSNLPQITRSNVRNNLLNLNLNTIFNNIDNGNGNEWGITEWDSLETRTISDNEFTVVRDGESTTTNILDEISQIIQNGSSNVSSDFATLNDYINPKIISWDNDGSILKIGLSIPTTIYLFTSDSGKTQWSSPIFDPPAKIGDTINVDVTGTVGYETVTLYSYDFTSATISFMNDFTSETEQTSYHSGNYPYSSENSMLFTEGVVSADTNRITVTTTDSDGVESLDGYVYDTFYAEDFADNLYDKYQNGKMQLSITYPVGHLQTINGLDVVYSEEYGLCTNIGNEYFDINGNKLVIDADDIITNISQIPEGTLCYITKNSEIYYKNSNGSPKLFVVQTSNLVYNGILVNELTLIESSEQFVSAFNESSWAEIDAMGKIGILQDHLSVGEQKTISLASGQDITLSILDFNHDDLTDGSGKAGMTIGMDSRLTDVYQMNSTATTSLSWNDCTFRTQIIPQLITDLPSDLQSIIQPVIKYSATSNNDLSTVNASEDKLFLQSLTEITGPAYIQNTASLSSIFSSNEGEQYEYWKTVKDGTITEDRKKFNKYGQSVNWTTRSVSSDTTTTNEGTTATFGVIDDNSGNIINVEPNTPETQTANHGISYAFCVGKQPFSFSGTLQDATWQQINYIANNGLAEQYFSVGDEKTITLSTGEEITLVILGFNHDQIYGEDFYASITFGMKNLLYDYYVMNNSATSNGGWGNSTMRNTTMQTLFSQLPADLQNIIKSVTKNYSQEKGTSTTSQSVDKLWLLSMSEIYASDEISTRYLQEGSQYEYWLNKIGNASPDNATEGVIKYMNNGQSYAGYWWTRSVNNINDGFGVINSNGFGISTISANDSMVSVSFGFCVGKGNYIFNKSLQNATWDEINFISTNGYAQQFFSVGDEKTIELSTGEQITVSILGFNHDDLSDNSGKAGITFGMNNLLETIYQMNPSDSNIGGWDNSNMRNTTMQTLFSQLPNDLQNVIKSVNKKASAGNQSTDIITSSDKLWLLSEVEIDGTENEVYKDEGYQYEYWRVVKDGTSSEGRIKYLSDGTGTVRGWWLRTAMLNKETSFAYVGNNGILYVSDSAVSNQTYRDGVSFGFCV